MQTTIGRRYTERGTAKERRTVIITAIAPDRIDWSHVYIPGENPYRGSGSTMPKVFETLFKEATP